VVFFLPFEAMSIRPLLWSYERGLAGAVRWNESGTLVAVEPTSRPFGLPTVTVWQAGERYTGWTFAALGPLSPASAS
jgi:hypothetical protein